MSNDQDPMLGDEATQKAYQAAVLKIMQETVEEVRAERRKPANDRETAPVMLGNMGFDGGISSA